MKLNLQTKSIQYLLFVLVLFLALVINGALPLVTTPTLYQALWATGFAESYTHDNLFNIFAHNIGYPHPAAIAFGLAATWPINLLLRIGLLAPDAYTIIFAIALTVAFVACVKLALQQGVSYAKSLLLALTWLSMPMVWVHAEFSMLQLGIALLPFYFLNFLNFLNLDNLKNNLLKTITFFCTPVLAIFMDGYTFMLYACGSSFLLLAYIYKQKFNREFLIKTIALVHFTSLVVAYLLFKQFIGKGEFGSGSLDFFRSWSLDLIFAAIPTQGIHWLPDLLGLSVARNSQMYYGDWSVWSTTFLLPLLVVSLIAFFVIKNKSWLSYSFLIVFLLSFYMGLGPTLKFNTLKKNATITDTAMAYNSIMTESQGLITTGNGVITKYVPGFKAMRASYRWNALAVFALWFLLMLAVSQNKKNQAWLIAGIYIVLVFNLPNLPAQLQTQINNRLSFFKIDNSLVAELKQLVPANSVALIIPSQNDFYNNYLAPKANIKTFNIGGDKNLLIAQEHWPEEVFAAAQDLNSRAIWPQIKLLASGKADVLIVPFADVFRANKCKNFANEANNPNCKITKPEIINFYNAIKDLSYLTVKVSDSFYTIELATNLKGAKNQEALKSILLNNLQLPFETNAAELNNPYVLSSGWHASEAQFTWSSQKAKLEVLAPESCRQQNCMIQLSFAHINNSHQGLELNLNGKKINIRDARRASKIGFDFVFPVDQTTTLQSIDIAVPNASSPARNSVGNNDSRILGAALIKINIIQP